MTMNILLINNNPVVSRLLALCLGNKSISLEEIHDAKEVSQPHYDLLFVDEASYKQETQEMLATLTVRQKVFFSHSDNKEAIPTHFDSILKKPFLPAHITEIVERLEAEDIAQSDTLFFIEEVEESHSNTTVLNGGEIEKIKALLEMDEVVEAESQSSPKKKKKKSKKHKKVKKQAIEPLGLEEVFLAKIKSMKRKKIQKLLQGAQITIKINFNKEET